MHRLRMRAHALAVPCNVQLADPYWPDVSGYGYQGLQPHQDAVIAAAEAQLLPLVKEAAARVSGSGSRRR